MPHHWPADTDFALWELDVHDRDCPHCGRMMYICDHRYRHVHTLEGPVELVCKLNHCPDPRCPGHSKTKSPEIEATIAPPHWAIGWDVFCWRLFRCSGRLVRGGVAVTCFGRMTWDAGAGELIFCRKSLLLNDLWKLSSNNRPEHGKSLAEGSVVDTDKFNIYNRLSEWGYTHHTVCHSAGEYARDDDGDGFCEVHVNTLEGFWSLLRSWLRPQRGISQKKLPW